MSLECFLLIDGIDGDSQDAQHKGAIAVQSWSFMENQAIASAGSGVGAGKVNLQSFQFTLLTGKASPKLFLAGASGQLFKTATLFCRRASQPKQDFLKITLSNVLVASFGTSTNANQDLTDQLTLSFFKMVYEVTPQKVDGSMDTVVRGGWDVSINKSIDVIS